MRQVNNEAERLSVKEDAINTASELEKKYNKKVYPITVDLPNEVVVGFISEPTLPNKMTAINYLAQQQIDKAGQVILSTSLIKEESDVRLCMNGGDDDVFISACLVANSLLNVYAVEIKKK